MTARDDKRGAFVADEFYAWRMEQATYGIELALQAWQESRRRCLAASAASHAPRKPEPWAYAVMQPKGAEFDYLVFPDYGEAESHVADAEDEREIIPLFPPSVPSTTALFRPEKLKELNDLHAIIADGSNPNYHEAADKFSLKVAMVWPEIAAALACTASATPCRLSGIYVASRVKQAEVWKAYRAKGWKINSTWIDEAGEGETPDFGDLWTRIRDEIARSHCLVFYAAGVEDFPFKGALVEVGMALAMGKPVIVALENVMLDGRTLRPVGSWLLDRKVIRCDTLEEAMDVARSADMICRPDGGKASNG